MPFLLIEKFGGTHKIIKFSSKIQIGRNWDNDIVLSERDDSAISRYHSHIIHDGTGFVLYNTSSNGTYVNGQNIKEYPLVDGMRFKVDNYLFTFLNDSEDYLLDKSAGSIVEIFSESGIDREAEEKFFSMSSYPLNKKIKLQNKLKDEGVIVENDAMLALFMDLEEIAKINVPVVILGETGTGKDIVASILHKFSQAPGEFVALNCSAIPAGIFESELFGSVKGAFHDAPNKPGKLEQADNGTIFLDEIGDMAEALQPKLLRFLDDFRVTRLGANESKKIKLRLIAATNQDLKSMIDNGSFRRDLYQRLACITLVIPPLRERKEDIIPLADFFLNQCASEYELGPKNLSHDAKKLLVSYHWPDNIRELQNTMLSAAIRCKKSIIKATDLPLPENDINSATMIIRQDELWSMEEVEKNHILKALRQVRGVKLQAAKLMGISRDTLYKKIKKYRI